MTVRVRNAGFTGIAVAVLLTTAAPAAAQSDSFDAGPVRVVSEWTALDRGDGSGDYTLVTKASVDGVEIEHALKAARSPMQEVDETETIRVLQGGAETARSGSDPTALGPWAEPAMRWALPFDLGFDAAPRKSYRLNDRKVREIVAGVIPDAKLSTRAGSDGRGMAQVEVPGVRPVEELAAAYVGLRKAFDEAGIALARLTIRGTAGPGAAMASE